MTLPNRTGYTTASAPPPTPTSSSSSSSSSSPSPTSLASLSSMLPLHQLQPSQFGRQPTPLQQGAYGGGGRTSAPTIGGLLDSMETSRGLHYLPQLYPPTSSSPQPSSASAAAAGQPQLSGFPFGAMQSLGGPSTMMGHHHHGHMGQQQAPAQQQPSHQAQQPSILPTHLMMYPPSGGHHHLHHHHHEQHDSRGLVGMANMMGYGSAAAGGLAQYGGLGGVLPPLHAQHPSATAASFQHAGPPSSTAYAGYMPSLSATPSASSTQLANVMAAAAAAAAATGPSSSPISASSTGTITIAPSLSPSVIDSSIEQLFPLSGRASTSLVPKEALHMINVPSHLASMGSGTILDSELAHIFNNVEMMETTGANEEVKVKMEPNPLHPIMLMVASAVGGKNLPSEDDWAARQQQSILNIAAIVPSPSSPASPSASTTSSSPTDSPALASGRSSSAHQLMSDWTLDSFCKSQGINLSSTPKTAKGEEFIEKVKKLQEAYEVELSKLNQVAEKYAAQMMALLKLQSTTRAVTEREQAMKLAIVQERFNYLRTQLRQSVCNAIVLLQKHYNQAKKKRRSLSKKATEVLNNWFFNHLNDPYPSDEEKMMLASLCGLTLNQVNNWFGNKRIRYKRKCLEEEAKRGKILQQEMHELASQQEAGNSHSSTHLYQYEPMAAGPAGVELDSGTSQYYI